jgi:hypothetical protein
VQKLINVVLGSTNAVVKLKRIVHCEKKIGFDGVYHQMVVESVTGNNYVLVFYSVPNKNYNEVLRYEFVRNGDNQK